MSIEIGLQFIIGWSDASSGGHQDSAARVVVVVVRELSDAFDTRRPCGSATAKHDALVDTWANCD